MIKSTTVPSLPEPQTPAFDAPASNRAAGRRFLIVSYYFGETSEVGAFRLNALAEHLLQSGAHVDVLFHNATGAPLRQRERLGLFPIDDPGEIYMPRIVRFVKGLLGVFRPRRDASPAAAAPVVEVPRAAPGPKPLRKPGVLGWIEHQVFTTIYVFNGKKRWARGAVRQGMSLARRHRYDCIISSAPPAVVGVVAGWIGWRTGTPYALDLRDPWNGNSVVPTAHSLARRLDLFAQRKCLTNATLITCASPGVRRLMGERWPALEHRMHVVLNGFDAVDRLDPPSNTGKLQLLYAGALYLKRNPFPLLESLKRFIDAGAFDRTRVRFTLVGDCESWNGVDVNAWCIQSGLSDVVSVLPRISRTELNSYRRDANVLVNLAQGQPDQIPAKTYDLLASGRDLLIITEAGSDTAEIMSSAGIKGCVDDSDPRQVDDALKALYSKWVLRVPGIGSSAADIESFSRDRQNRAWTHLLGYAS